MKTLSFAIMVAALVVVGCTPRKGAGSESAASQTSTSGNEPSGMTSDAPTEARTDGQAEATPTADSTAEAFPPGAWSAAEPTTWQRIYEDRGQHLNLMNSTCGTEITMSFNHEAFRDRLAAVDANRNEDWNASALLMEIRNACLAGDAQKQAVATKIHSIYFARTPAAHGLEGGVLQIALDTEANPRAYVGDFATWLRSVL